MWYQFLNIFFFVFHTAFTLFNIVGWMFPRTRRLHLITLFLTACSWFILGIWYGWGYCVCTHWHWLVREKLGYHDYSVSYIHFLILKLTGANLDQQMVERVTLVIFLLCAALSIWLNARDLYRKRKTASSYK
ncbi:MAG TPA: DUF2784 domain-containing protein [Puia sp.]|nr:DUF2784 domain-containing protein [Puia sp.]